MTKPILIRRALELKQDPAHPLYLFAMRPRELLDVASISRISRQPAADLIGYQRGEVKRHVTEIQKYLDTGAVLFPNAVILAFSDEVVFRRSRGPKKDDGLAAAGVLHIPVAEADETRPAWIVDGQQRALALSRSSNADMPVPVAAFFSADLKLQRDQFLRINNARPLPKGLVTELLPEVDTFLPRRMAANKLPSALCAKLNELPASPFCGIVRRASTPSELKRGTYIRDTSVIDMIRPRLNESGGCLFPYRNIAKNETDTDRVLALLIGYWAAVRDTFPEAWARPPKRSRLTHGAGIKAMGALMDKVVPSIDADGDIRAQCAAHLAGLVPHCAWTEGRWEGLNLAWNGIENTSKGVSALSNHLIRQYLTGARPR